MTIAIMLLVLLCGAWVLAVIETWSVTGRLRPAAPVLTGLANLGRESLVPRRPDRLFFESAPVLLLVVAVLGGFALAKGAFLVGKHEGDTLHLVDMVLRMGLAGQVPHLDFMTPIGIGATWPIAAFVAAGFGVGHAFSAQA